MTESAATAPPRAGIGDIVREMFRPKAASIEQDIDFAAPGALALGRDVGVFDPVRMARFNLFTRAIVVAVAIATWAGARLKGMTIEIGDAEIAFYIAGFMAAIAIVYTCLRPAPRIAAASTMLAEQMIYGVLFINYSYVAVAWGGHEQAPNLAHIDALLGFDWLGYKAALENSPTLLAVVRFCYSSIAWQNFVVPIGLLLFGRLGWLRLFMNCFALGSALNMVVAMLAPAIDAQAYYVFDALNHPGVSTGFALSDHYMALRVGAMKVIDFAVLTGVISFPSFHTYLALLYLFAAWPLRKLWYLLLPVNALLIVGTPRFGFHFLADIFAGACLAALVMGVSYRYLRAAPRTPA